MNLDLLEVIRKSFTMFILIFCSVITLAFTIERWWFFWKIKLNLENFMATLKKYIEDADFEKALNLCRTTKNPVAKVMEVAIINHKKPKSQVIELMNAARLEQRVRMEQFIIVLGTMATICPFLGLFGTVIGIIRAFHDLAISGSGGPSVVAAGISEALVATAAGLGVAIPAVVLFNYFMKKVKNFSSAMETNQAKILVYLNIM